MKKNRELYGNTIEIYVKSVETVLQAESTIQEALELIRKKSFEETIRYFYVVDAYNKLVGILPTRKFLLTHPSTKLSEVMDRDFVTINPSSTIEHAMKLFIDHQLLALPVVDFHGGFMGIIDVYFCIEDLKSNEPENVEQDVFQMVGISLEQNRRRSTLNGYKNRMPWLLFNIMGGVICASISDHFEGVLSGFLVLAFFIPLVLGLSESVSMQAMSLSVYALQSNSKQIFKNLFVRGFHEIKISSLLAFTCGLLVAVCSLFFYSGFRPAFSIGISILISISCSALFGALFPILLHGLRLDPRVASGPIVLMAADVLTTFVYLALSTWLLLG